MKTKTLLLCCLIFICSSISAQFIKTGAEQIDKLLPLLKGKRVALVVNHSSIVGNKRVHLLDTLISSGIKIKKIFAPEHGFRGDADAGETVRNGKDVKTGIPIISLYGANKKPNSAQMNGIDIVLFDIQDVGARFYTYISTMHYVMEACAENDIPLIIADRPNPCDYVDGPIRKKYLKSFVSLDPIPILHGCTIGELAQMINGEKWLDKGITAKVSVIPVEGWKHGQPYSLPVKPSPNLPNDQAVALYPSLCPFEGTAISVGRGTKFPFQVIGSPDIKIYSFSYTPRAMHGFDKNPMYNNIQCYGNNLRHISAPKGFSLKYIIAYYNEYKKYDKHHAFFTRPRWFDTLIGDPQVRKMIIQGKSEDEIRATWKDDLERYSKIREKYLIY